MLVLTRSTQPGELTKRSLYPEVWGSSHSACAGFLEVQGFKYALTNG